MSGNNSFFNHNAFNKAITTIIEQELKDIRDIETIIGIPFYNEQETLLAVVSNIARTLKDDLGQAKTMLVLAGDPVGEDSLRQVNELGLTIPYLGYLLPQDARGRGASVRSLMEIANYLEADLVILATDMVPVEPDKFRNMLFTLIEPVRHNYDLAVARFNRSFGDDLASILFTSPLLEVFYGSLISDPHSRIYAISHDLVENFLQELKLWNHVVYDYGIDPWLLTRALRWGKRLCEVYLGEKSSFVSKDKMSYVFKQTIYTLFDCIKRDIRFLLGREPVYYRLDNWGRAYFPEYKHEATPIDADDLVLSFRQSCAQYQHLIKTILPERLADRVMECLIYPEASFSFDHNTWAKTVYHYLLVYCFNEEIPGDDLMMSLTFIFDGRMADVLYKAREDLEKEAYQEGYATVGHLGEPGILQRLKEEQRNAFFEARDEFISMWSSAFEEHRPPLIPVHHLEFVPGAPILINKKLRVFGSEEIWTQDILGNLQSTYHELFDDFMARLGVSHEASPDEKVQGLQQFMAKLEMAFDRIFPGDLYTESGVREVMERIFELFCKEPVFTFKNEAIAELLAESPPPNLLLTSGCSSVEELLQDMDARTVLAMAFMTENQAYFENCINWLAHNCRHEMMGFDSIKYLVAGFESVPYATRLPVIARLERLTHCIIASPYSKGLGGRYPKLRYVLYVMRQIAMARNYSRLWETYCRERKNLGNKIINSLLYWRKGSYFSVGNLFEVSHHRLMMQMWDDFIRKTSEYGTEEDKQVLALMIRGYGLSQVLENGVFLPCSAWTWASYSYKGGQGIPTPAASQVEINWFNYDLFEQLYYVMSYSRRDLDNQIGQMLGEGRTSEDLLDLLVGAEGVRAVSQDPSSVPEAGRLKRYPGNPILMPVKEHPWESKYVLNAASFRIKDRVYILYRAFGDDEVSRIGLAISDGYRILERLSYPIFEPASASESMGCEDPRTVVIEDQILMIYTAYDGRTAQVAGASISIDDFLNRRFEKWQRLGLAFKDVWDKDALIFPEKINGRYVIYHRIEPSIWVSYMNELKFPVSKEKHVVIMGPRSGRMWDSAKIGAGTQPLKTKYGWLMIYHGVDRNRVYRLGVMLVDLTNPEKLLYRSPNPILEPEEEYELGTPDKSWVPNVVFTCGAVPVEDKEILDAEDEIIVYYGAADTCVCAASAKVGELIPEEIRKKIEKASRELSAGRLPNYDEKQANLCLY